LERLGEVLTSLGQFARPLVELLLKGGGCGTATARSGWRFTAHGPRCLLTARLHFGTAHSRARRPSTSLDAPPSFYFGCVPAAVLRLIASDVGALRRATCKRCTDTDSPIVKRIKSSPTSNGPSYVCRVSAMRSSTEAGGTVSLARKTRCVYAASFGRVRANTAPASFAVVWCAMMRWM